jgi:phosphate/sulfate permease
LLLLLLGWAPVAYVGVVVLHETLIVILSPILALVFTAYLYVFLRFFTRNAKRS